MGRTRTIDRGSVLDATERVIARDGAVGLSIDAVAREAGISKASVVYDHKSKAGLLTAMIRRRLDNDAERIEAAVNVCKDAPHPALYGRIASALQVLSEMEKAIVLAVSASASNEQTIKDPMREYTRIDLEAMESGPKPRAALLAYLALSGLYSIELFGFHAWDETQREQILQGIQTTYESYPE